MSNEPVQITLEFTPNPNTLKYAVNRTLVQRGAANFLKLEDAEGRSELASQLLKMPGISGVMLGMNFVTITKNEEGDWDEVHEGASACIKSYLESDKPVLIGNESISKSEEAGSETEGKIRQIIEDEIRPAVAQDGGDILFQRYSDGIVYLVLTGSCAGCPSSTMTLKVGIENRLREVVPEIQDVVAVE